jgi:S1-C subfamily serine protease
VVRGWLGIGIQDLSSELADSFGLDRAVGALVNQVQADSPAQQAGIRRGDIMLELNGRTIRNASDLQLQIVSTPAGKTVPLKILRDGQPMIVEVTVRRQNQTTASNVTDVRQSLGLTLINTENNNGIAVKDVAPQSIAAAKEIRQGDIILALNKTKLTDLHSFDRALSKARKGRMVRLLIKRGDATLYLAFPVTAWGTDSAPR